MLSARYLANVSNDVVRLYAQLEHDIIMELVDSIKRLGKVDDLAMWQIQVLKETGGLNSRINQYVAKYNVKAQAQIKQILFDALKKAERNDLTYINEAKRKMSESQLQMIDTTAQRLKSSALVTGSKGYQESIKQGQAIKVFSGLERLTQTIAATAQDDFVSACNRAYMQVNSGAFSYKDALIKAVDSLAARGVHTVEYTDSGKTINRSIESAVRTNILTGVNLAASQQTLNNCDETDTDLVEVSAHIGARPEHEEWQGKVYCLSGERDYIDADGNTQHALNFYDVCQIGTPTGICGINCRHSYHPYFEGTPLQYSKGELDEYKEETVKYNNQQISVYEAEQNLRGFERGIRKYKLKKDALIAVGGDTTIADKKLQQYEAAARDICKQTGIKRDYSREYVGKR